MTQRRTDAPGHRMAPFFGNATREGNHMLCLGRTRGQSITLTLPEGAGLLAGATIVVSIERVSLGAARIGIQADRSIGIVRTELGDRPSHGSTREEFEIEDLGSSVD